MGEVRGQVACSMDWMPTIAELCGVRPLDRRLDGRSIVSVLKSADAPSPHDVLHWQSGNMWAVREGKWKLVATMPRGAGRATGGAAPGPALFLADMDADVGEKRNLADQHGDVVRRMRNLHRDWGKEVRRQ